MPPAEPKSIFESCRDDCNAAGTCCNGRIGIEYTDSGCFRSSCLQACLLLRTEGTAFYGNGVEVATSFCGVVTGCVKSGFQQCGVCDHGFGVGVTFDSCPTTCNDASECLVGAYLDTPPPAPSLPPPRPPFLPVPVGMVYKSKVTVSIVLSGTVDTFDADAYKANMAPLLEGVDPSDITLSVSAASVQVVAEIIAADASIADSVVTTIQSYDSGAMSAALGVTVEQVVAPVIEVVVLTAPPPPSPEPLSPPPTPPFPWFCIDGRGSGGCTVAPSQLAKRCKCVWVWEQGCSGTHPQYSYLYCAT